MRRSNLFSCAKYYGEFNRLLINRTAWRRLIVVRGLDECVQLPDLVGRKSKTKGRHLRPLASVDHDFEELFVAEFRRENIRSACAGALVTNEALASIDIA